MVTWHILKVSMSSKMLSHPSLRLPRCRDGSTFFRFCRRNVPYCIGNIANRRLIERIADAAPLSLLQRMSPGSPIQTDTKTLVSPLESVDTHPTSGSCSPALLFPRGSIDIHKAIPYGETTLARVDGSIGNVFIRSLDDRRSEERRVGKECVP